MKNAPGLFAVIPASVRYDQEIPANAKVLFAEISALTGTFGYCWASDEYFQGLFGLTAKTICNLLKALEDKNYIRISDTQNVGSDRCRKIEIDRTLLATGYTPAMLDLLKKQENIFQILENIFPDSEKIFHANNVLINNNIPPKAPQGGQVQKPKRKRDYKETADHLPERFEAFWRYYQSVVPETKTPGTRQNAIRAWDKLAPSAELIAEMGRALMRQSQTEDWTRGIGVPHASTWINGHRWEDPVAGLRQPAQAPEPRADEEAGVWL